MNYKLIHDKIIERAKSENRKKTTPKSENFIYYEEHHILPRSLGGNNSRKNLILLTAKEHFLIHRLLHELNPDNISLFRAYWMMRNMKGYTITNREYEEIKTRFAEVNSETHKGKVISVEMAQQIREKLLGRSLSKEHKTNISNYVRNMTQEHRDNISKGLKGKCHTQEHKDKIGKGNTGKVRTEEFKEKISNNLKEGIQSGKIIPNISGLKSHIKGEFTHNDETKEKLSKVRKGKKWEDIMDIEKVLRNKERLKLLKGEKNPSFKSLNAEYIKQQLDNGVLIKDLKKELNTSYQTLSNRFKDKYEITISEYRNRSSSGT